MKHHPKDRTKGTNIKRNAAVCRLANEQRLSYSVIGEMMGLSRNVVAGVVFRQRHPIKTRVSTSRGLNNKIGTGYSPPSYYPEKTARNTR